MQSLKFRNRRYIGQLQINRWGGTVISFQCRWKLSRELQLNCLDLELLDEVYIINVETKIKASDIPFHILK
jgi:hypothetical protein